MNNHYTWRKGGIWQKDCSCLLPRARKETNLPKAVLTIVFFDPFEQRRGLLLQCYTLTAQGINQVLRCADPLPRLHNCQLIPDLVPEDRKSHNEADGADCQ